jgi:hypothetical protein
VRKQIAWWLVSRVRRVHRCRWYRPHSSPAYARPTFSTRGKDSRRR